MSDGVAYFARNLVRMILVFSVAVLFGSIIFAHPEWFKTAVILMGFGLGFIAERVANWAYSEIRSVSDE